MPCGIRRKIDFRHDLASELNSCRRLRRDLNDLCQSKTVVPGFYHDNIANANRRVIERIGILHVVIRAVQKLHIRRNIIVKHKINLVTFKRNRCLAVLGLLERQNEYSTPPFTQKQVAELLDGLRQIAPYVIVDCGSYIANDILSAVALMEADSILRLANCDPKSVNYFASQLPLLDGPEWDMDKQYKVASNVKPYQAADHIGKVLGDTAFVLPYSQELEEQYLAGTLLADLTLKDSRPFRKELEKIIAEVF